MNAGYLRLSKDDDRRNYASIENQKLIISQYAAERGETIQRWYEDDGISGYTFDRSGFRRLMADLDQDIDTVYVKDFSRLGRHNARILLLLDEFQERGIRLIVTDDHYDNAVSDDDMIGIKTWFNERYVKDTSKKIRRVLRAKQKDGSLVTLPPFGYRRAGEDHDRFEIIPRQAAIVRRIYSMYMEGYGYRRLAEYLTSAGIGTPSMIRREQELAEGRITGRRVAAVWTDSMVKAILDNDFYAGTYRLHKRERPTIHGKDRRVPAGEQIVFRNHHDPIIDPLTFELVQKIKAGRSRGNYKGSRKKQENDSAPSPFGGCLYCKCCGHKMTPVVRKADSRTRRYFICSLYNTKGKQACAKSHLIEETLLTNDVIRCLKTCRDLLKPAVDSIRIGEPKQDREYPELSEIEKRLEREKKRLETLISQKIRDIASCPEQEDLIRESYSAVQAELSAKIRSLQSRNENLRRNETEAKSGRSGTPSAPDIIDGVIAGGAVTRTDIETLIDRIDVDEHGFPEIHLRYALPDPAAWTAEKEVLEETDAIILAALSLVKNDTRGFVSARSLAAGLADMNMKVSRSNINIILSFFQEMGIVTISGNRRRPWPIIMEKDRLEELIANFPANMPFIRGRAKDL